jgi:uncharacterized membrane protein YdjX (TVP38/TMEM64 family)
VPHFPRSALLVLAVAATVIASKVVVENLLGLNLGDLLARWSQDPGAGAATIIITLLVVDILLPVPSSLVMLASGALFGVAWGSLLSLIGSIGGELFGFEMVRRFGAPVARRLAGDDDLRRLSGLMTRHGAAAVAATRALPVVMETMSVVAGLSAMSRRTFLGASLLGTVPVAVVYAWAGASARGTGSLIPAVVMLIAVTAAGWIWYRSHAVR